MQQFAGHGAEQQAFRDAEAAAADDDAAATELFGQVKNLLGNVAHHPMATDTLFSLACRILQVYRPILNLP